MFQENTLLPLLLHFNEREKTFKESHLYEQLEKSEVVFRFLS